MVIKQIVYNNTCHYSMSFVFTDCPSVVISASNNATVSATRTTVPNVTPTPPTNNTEPSQSDSTVVVLGICIHFTVYLF